MTQHAQDVSLGTVVVDTSGSGFAGLRPVPISAVVLSDDFWKPRRRVNREITLRQQFQKLEESGVLDNFRRVVGKSDAPYRGRWFADSDLYKWLEAASWSLAEGPDVDLESLVTSGIGVIEDAQEPGGYLATYYMVERKSRKWTELAVTHELYCAGHLFQAAVAHHRATDDDRLLNVAVRLADHICETFGAAEDGKLPGVDGHPEVEMALVELARETGDVRYVEQARYFIDARGHGLLGTRKHHEIHGLPGGREYQQDHKPLREQHEIVGHAVRAVYLNAGAADLFAETGDDGIRGALEHLWTNMTSRRMYVSGGIGSRYDHESFGKDYELPNSLSYAETCAAIGSVMWNWRMLLLDGDCRYADLIEHTLFNAVLPGLSLDGQAYFYQNPLSDDGERRRQPWFGVACCPPNISRLLASLPGYFYSTSDEGIWVHLYSDSTASLRLGPNHTVSIRQSTNYPWQGDVEMEVDGEGEFGLMLRIPGWCASDIEISVNGTVLDTDVSPGSYARIQRAWQQGDTVRLSLPMPVRRVVSNPRVTENTGQVALMRGPLLYCLEQVDNPGSDLRDVILPDASEFEVRHQPDLLNGVTILRATAEVVETDPEWGGRLYETMVSDSNGPGRRDAEIAAVPYYAWANREAGALQVWIKRRPA